MICHVIVNSIDYPSLAIRTMKEEDFNSFSSAEKSACWRRKRKRQPNDYDENQALAEGEEREKNGKVSSSTTTTKRTWKRRSHGINPKQFHSTSTSSSLSPCVSSRRQQSTPSLTSSSKCRPSTILNNKKMTLASTKKILLHAKIRVDHNSFKDQYDSFVQKSVFKYWPIQQPALQHLDELLLLPATTSSSSSSAMLSWSMEPRIFAVETSSTGKRKYVVCHLGRFMHHYWRTCQPHARKYYELIRENTPCRLYFGALY